MRPSYFRNNQTRSRLKGIVSDYIRLAVVFEWFSGLTMFDIDMFTTVQ